MDRVKALKIGSAIAVFAALTACGGGGDVEVSPTNVDNSTDNSCGGTNSCSSGGGSTDNPCASYSPDGGETTRRGTFDGANCTYDSAFVGKSNPLTVDLTIPFISGVHIFQDSLFVGQNVNSGRAPQEGEGPTLTIAAGNTLAFSDSADYILINRGSKIIANGSQVAPITFTSFSDAVTGTAGPEDVSLWGGLVINGNGITNNCTAEQRASDQCHVGAEGQPSNYGGNNNEESSGELRYVVVKHPGFEVAPGDELNGVTFNAVGSGTVVENLEVYSTYDDGVEFFGGAVNITNLVAVYVRDDSIDFSDGFVGTIDRALIVQSDKDGNRCVEGDNIGEGRANGGEPLDTAPLSHPTIRNMTCVMGMSDTGTHDPSEGIILRRGATAVFENAILFGAYVDDAGNNNECWEIDDTRTQEFAIAGDTTMNSTIIACDEPTKDDLSNGDSLLVWTLNSNGAYPFNMDNVVINTSGRELDDDLQILDSYYTATSFVDPDGAGFDVPPVGDASIVGAVARNDDWTLNWTYGLHASNRGQPLWFE